MDIERIAAVSLVIQFGAVVWLASGPREKNPVAGNLMLFFVSAGLMSFVAMVLTLYGKRTFIIAGALGGLMDAYALGKRKAGEPVIPFLMRSYALGPSVGLFSVAILMFVLSKQPQEEMAAALRNMVLVGTVIGDLLVVVFLAIFPGRAELGRFFAGFLVPGLGHALLGKFQKAAFFFLSIAGLYVAGLALTSFRMVGREDNPFYWYGQFFAGFTTVTSLLLPPGKAHLPPGWSYAHFDPGLLYVCAAALLNYVVAINVFEFKAPEPAAETAPKPEAPA